MGSDATALRVLIIVVARATLAEELQHAVADGASAIRRGKRDEIVAADVPDEVRRHPRVANRALDQPGHRRDRSRAPLVPIPIDVSLEVVDVDVAEGEIAAPFDAPGDLSAGRLVAGQPGEAVGG